jgi:hypothetical protein
VLADKRMYNMQVQKIDKEMSVLMHNVSGEMSDEVQHKLGALIHQRKEELRKVFIRVAITSEVSDASPGSGTSPASPTSDAPVLPAIVLP